MIVYCEHCHRVLDREEAHDFADTENQMHYWCSECCPVCALSDPEDEQLTLFPLES